MAPLEHVFETELGLQQQIQSRIERMERSLWDCKACDWLTAESLLDVFPSGDASLSSSMCLYPSLHV